MAGQERAGIPSYNSFRDTAGSFLNPPIPLTETSSLLTSNRRPGSTAHSDDYQFVLFRLVRKLHPSPLR